MAPTTPQSSPHGPHLLGGSPWTGLGQVPGKLWCGPGTRGGVTLLGVEGVHLGLFGTLMQEGETVSRVRVT